MALTKYAQKLLSYLGLYKITATEYTRRISGSYDNQYNFNRFIGDFATSKGTTPRISASPKKGVFKTALAELVSYGY